MKLLFDFFPILLFFLVYKFYTDIPAEGIDTLNSLMPFLSMQAGESSHAIYLATLVAILATVVQVFYSSIALKKIEKMHLVTLGLLVVFGGATLLLRDPVFIKWKPTVINWLFAAAFIGSLFIGEKPLVQRMLSKALAIPDRAVWVKLNWAWVGFFVFSGAANLFVAFQFSEEAWVNFKLFGLMGLTFAFMIGQFMFLSRYIVQEEESSGKQAVEKETGE